MDLLNISDKVKQFFIFYGKNDSKVKKFIDNCKNLEFILTYGKRLIHYVCEFCSFEMIKYLANKGVNLEVYDNFGITPIFVLCEYSSLESLKFFADKGVNFSIETNRFYEETNHFTVLHSACLSKSLEKVKFLIDIVGIPLPEIYNDDFSIMHFIAKYSSYEIFKYFESKGFDANLNYYDITPLLVAIEHSNDNNLIKYLIDSNKDFEIRNEDDYDLVQIACINFDFVIMKYLYDKGYNFDTLDDEQNNLMQLIYNNERYEGYYNVDEEDEYEIIEFLLSVGISPNFKNKHGLTIMNYAIEHNRLEICQLLIDHGVNVNSTNNIGDTLVHMACEYMNFDILLLLVKNGANIDLENDLGLKPIHCIVSYHVNDDIEDFYRMVDFFINHYIDLETKTKKNENLLDLVYKNWFNIDYQIPNLINCLKYLIDKGMQINHKTPDEKLVFQLICEKISLKHENFNPIEFFGIGTLKRKFDFI
jgi:ankyrin repeat protein